ncbi:dipeptidase [Caproiciproducens sp. LBM24188]|nr:membrane dipeptidase [Oscillospiraceae bacterium]HHV32526.1 membrane dipeptidase [Clostridiales bacterium]
MNSVDYFDLHCDTIGGCYESHQSLFDGDLHISLKRGSEFRTWFQCFAVFIPDDLRGQKAVAHYDALYGQLQKEIQRYSKHVMFCKTADDLANAQREHKIGAILTVEGGAALGGSLERLAFLAECGVKAMTLTWNSSCEIGDGADAKSPKGLTNFGKEVIAEMERQNIAIDISHASDALFYDVASLTAKPFLATHSNSRTLCGHRRNLTDEQFQVIRDRGGLVGINFVPEFLNESGIADLQDVLKHVEHFLALGGERCLAVGSDFDGIGTLPSGITGVESIENLAEEMLRHNYSENLVHSILFDNAYHFFLSLF